MTDLPTPIPGRITELSTRLAALESRGAERERENGALRDELRRVSAERDEVAALSHQYRNEVAALREQLARAEEHRDQLQREQDCAREQLAAAQAELERHRRERASELARDAERILQLQNELEAARQPAPLPEGCTAIGTTGARDRFGTAAWVDAGYLKIRDPHNVSVYGISVEMTRALLSLPAPSAPATAPNVARALEECEMLFEGTSEGQVLVVDRDAVDRIRAALQAPVELHSESHDPTAAARESGDATKATASGGHTPGGSPSGQAPVAQAAPACACVVDHELHGLRPNPDCPVHFTRRADGIVEPTQQAAPVIVGRAATYAEIVEVSKALKAERQAAPREEPRTHELKTWPDFFGAVLDGRKTFELRKNDRDFRVGDTLRLREYAPGTDEYTGRECTRTVTYVTDALAFGAMRSGFVCLGLATPAPSLARLHALADRWDRDALLDHRRRICARELREALAAGAELHGLPSRWTKNEGGDGYHRENVSADGERLATTIVGIDGLGVFVDDPHDDVTATELHAVLAFHLRGGK